MLSAVLSERAPPPHWAATDPVGEVANVPSVRPEIEHRVYQNPQQGRRRPLNQKRPDTEKRKPSDPEHKVDDYA